MSTVFLSKTHLNEDGSVNVGTRTKTGSLVVSQDRATQDAFGRLRVSSPLSQFDYQNQYNDGPLIWSTTLSGTGSARVTGSETVTAQFPLALDIDGANPDTMSLVCTSFTGTATVSASITFREYY